MERNFLRPMRIGEIFDAVFFILRSNFKTLVNLNVMLFLPAFIVSLLAIIGSVVVYFMNPMIFESFKSDKPDFTLIIWVILAVLVFIGIMIMVSVTFLYNLYGVIQVYDAAINGRKITWKESLKGSLKGILFIFVAGILVGIVSTIISFPLSIGLSILGMASQNLQVFFTILNQLLSFMIGTILAVFIYIAYPLIVIEKKDPVTAVWRSCCLVWKNFWRTVGIYLLFLLMSFCTIVVAIVICMIPLMILAVQYGDSLIHNFDITMLFNPLLLISAFLLLTVMLFLGFVFYNAGFGLQVLVFYDLRMRSEGYDLMPTDSVNIVQKLV